jgi:hypothetical protein
VGEERFPVGTWVFWRLRDRVHVTPDGKFVHAGFHQIDTIYEKAKSDYHYRIKISNLEAILLLEDELMRLDSLCKLERLALGVPDEL